MAEAQEIIAEEGTDVEAPRSGRFKNLLIKSAAIGFIVAVIAGECLVAWLYLPSTSEATSAVQEIAQAARNGAEIEDPFDPEVEASLEEKDDTELVQLGDFDLAMHLANEQINRYFTFQLSASVKPEDKDELLESWTSNEDRLRDQINEIIRNAKITDLTDPGLGLIKRQILTKVNRTLGKPYLQSVYFPNFTYREA